MEKFILFAPLVASIIAGFGWRVISEKGAQVLTTIVLFAACAMSWAVFLGFDGTVRHIHGMDWIVTEGFHGAWGIRIDRLTAALAAIVLSSAVPTEPPTCCMVLTVADATPASSGSTPDTAPCMAGAIDAPSPTPMINSAGRT